MNQDLPPTPSPSLPSHSQRNSILDYPHHPYLPPTPPQIHYAMDGASRSHNRHASINSDAQATLRRNASSSTRPALSGYSSYTREEDESEPTLSFMTSSTNDSNSSGPDSAIGVAYSHEPSAEGVEHEKKGQRARTRTATGRANAYSSAESSTASGFYTVNTYPSSTPLQHPHPPPLPTRIYHPEIGLGISADDASPARPVRTSSYNAGQSILTRRHSKPIQTSPTNTTSPTSPWQESIANRMRSDSASSSASAASYSDRQGDTSASESDIDGRPGRYPWEGEDDTEDEEQQEAIAISLVEKGRERILDETRIRSMGGLDVVVNERLNELVGSTHILLAEQNDPHLVTSLLMSILPYVASTLVVLDLSSCYLSSLPSELALCAALEELNVANNQLGSLPSWLGELISMRVLVVDGCGLHNLPAELVAVRSLHTICARRNRMIALPAWLSLLPNLETLRIDGNPFAGVYKTLVEPILIRTENQEPQDHALHSAASSTSMSSHQFFSSQNSSASALASADMYSPEAGLKVPPSSAEQPVVYASVVDDEDDLPVHTGVPVSRGLRKMRSAGSLLGLRPSTPSGQSKPTPKGSSSNLASTSSSSSRIVSAGMQGMASAPLVNPSVGKYATIGGRSATAMSNYADVDLSDDDEPRPMQRAAPAQNKTGKWGFLRKMSMGKMRQTNGSASATLSASAIQHNKAMPVLNHSNSDPIQSAAHVRPGFKHAKSAMTLPSRAAMPVVGEFGQEVPAAAPAGLSPSGLPSPIGMQSLSVPGGRGKRRSFLPIDGGPPHLNIPIPSMSPFLRTTSIFGASHSTNGSLQELDEGTEVFLGDTPLHSAAPSAGSSRPFTPLSLGEARNPLPTNQEMQCALGLKSIKSYLRDLYDLSLPLQLLPDGAEVLESESPSQSVTSDARTGSPSPYASNVSAFHSSPAASMRARRPTGENLPRHGSLNSDVPEDRSSMVASEESHARSPVEDVTTKRGYKEDKHKRAKVVREVIETERTYVRSLSELVSIYVQPSGAPVNPGKPGSESIIPLSERKIVFGGIEGILQFHKASLLPAMEAAGKDILAGKPDPNGSVSALAARAMGDVFRSYNPFMRQYSSYINNFDNSLARMRTWIADSSSTHSSPSLGSSKPTSPSGSGIQLATVSMGLGMSSMAPTITVDALPTTKSNLTAAQRKRINSFLKRCRLNRTHSQINLESYLLLPVQRIPRYKLLLEDLAVCTAPTRDLPYDSIDDAMQEISTLASSINEEKRESESRRRLVQWQTRIRGSGPSPLVQPHRRLILDGPLTLTRIVRKTSSIVEVFNSPLDLGPGFGSMALNDHSGDQTITSSKSIVQIEHLAPPEVSQTLVVGLLTSDLMVLVRDSKEEQGKVDIHAVLRMQTKREPASVINGNVLRLVNNNAILYFSTGSTSAALQWSRAINIEFSSCR